MTVRASIDFSAAPWSSSDRHDASMDEPGLSCAAAFQFLARGSVADILANRAAACRGSPDAVHNMRIAITRLRAAVSFFAPMASDGNWPRLKKEVRWLNTSLGAARDLDVTMQYLRKTPGQSIQNSLRRHQARSRGNLGGVLRSSRFEGLISALQEWIEHGEWFPRLNKKSIQQRSQLIARYCRSRLERWISRLKKKGRKFETMSAAKRHRLRIGLKRLRYMLDAFATILNRSHASRFRKTRQYVRGLQRLLGQLRDLERVRSLASNRKFALKQESRITKKATSTLRTFARPKGF